jgi:hypothetical protein
MTDYAHLKAAIKHCGLLHGDVAKVICKSEAQFSNLINGKAEFAPHEKTRIAELLGFSESWLFQPLVIHAGTGFSRREIAVLGPAIETRSRK